MTSEKTHKGTWSDSVEPAKVGHSRCQMSVVISIFLFLHEGSVLGTVAPEKQPSFLKLQVVCLEGLNVAVS